MPPKIKVSPNARLLQDRLHNLLSNLSRTIAHVKQWPPEQSLSANNTDQLGKHIREVLAAASAVETSLKANHMEYQTCWIPLDLLELLEHTGMKTDKEYGLNPDCFLRGLIKEATGQLMGLKRRKLALERLGSAVQAGLDQRTAAGAHNTTSNKRARDDDDETESETETPPDKKVKTEEG